MRFTVSSSFLSDDTCQIESKIPTNNQNQSSLKSNSEALITGNY